MASKRKKVAKAVPLSSADLANITKASPYVQRLIEDSALRDNIATVVDSSKSAVDRVRSSKDPYKAVLEDKKMQKDVQQAAAAFRDAASALSNAPKKAGRKRKRRGGGLLLVLLVAVGAALGFSESLRSKVLDTLFGAEEEFQYTPPAPAPSSTTQTSPMTGPVSAA